MSPTLGLDYAPTLDDILLARVEAAARRCGLPLARVELLGQCERTATAFVAAAASDRAQRFLEATDWDALEGRMEHRPLPSHAIAINVF